MKNILTTYVLILLNVLVFVLMLKFGGMKEIGAFSIHTLLVFGADYTPLVKLGQWYRPVAAMFIHLNFLHLLMNMVALLQVGIPLERLYGRPRFAGLYVFAGLTGAAASLLYYSRVPVVSAGASGAITGLIGAAAVASHRAGPAGVPLRNVMLRWLLLVFGYGFMAKADNAAHFGGLVGGVLLALAMPSRAKVRVGLSGANQGVVAPNGGETGALGSGREEESPSSGERPIAGGPAVGALRGQGLSPAGASTTGPGFETILLVALVAVTFGVALSRKEEALSGEELVNKGVEAAQAGRDDEALELYRRALVLDPKDATAWYDLGLALGRKGDFSGAVAAISKAIEIGGVEDAQKGLIAQHQRRARELLEAGKIDEGLEALKPALALDENNTVTLSLLAFGQSNNKDGDAAIATLRKALSIAPDDELKRQLSAILVNRAVEMERADKDAKTTALYREATELNPTNGVAWYDLGLSLCHEKDWPGARDALERANAISPRRGAYETLVAVYTRLGDEKKARDAAEAAEKIPKE